MDNNDYIKFALDAINSDARFDDVDKSTSSAFYNLNILPFSVLLKPVHDLNMNTINAMDLDTMTSDQLDKFGSTLFIKRKSKNYTTLEITMYFTNPVSTVEPCIITTSDEFRTSSNRVYRPLQDHVIIIDRLPLISGKRVATIMTVSYDNYSIILANSIKTTSVIHASLESVDNLSSSSTPVSDETDDEFKIDIQQAIGTRSNTNAGSIYTNIKQNFQDVIDCLPICYGDPEMQRDIAVAAKTWSGHFGGMTDILIRTSVVPATFNINASPTVGNDGVVFTLRRYKGYDWYANDVATPNSNQLMPWTLLDGTTLPILPLLFINWLNTTIDNNTIAINSVGLPDYTIEVLPDPLEKSYGKNYRFSQYENIRITIKCNDPVLSTTNVKLSYYTLSNVENIQNYISDNYNRASCANNLVKSFIPIEITKLVVVYNPSNTFTQALWKQTLADIINNYNSTNILHFSYLFKSFPTPVRLSEAWKGNNNLPYTFDVNGEIATAITPAPTPGSYPTYATMIQHNIDGSKNYYASTRQLYQLKTSNGLSATSRTCRYFILPENIVFESEA